ncbi:MAG: phosphoglycerate dehydrogenase [Holophagaceae bacterium]|uniref:D-3-phosphoglycerate dehydrogenase n=1 Tax=Candidatus Geothrix skivensis TaxID=2954439 RepID=A0A9D7XJZ5_9BACT|nr:phosphoglycerate dehydrogenase [Candidatus Geothrix skivensis]
MKIIVTDEVTGEGLALLQADPRISLEVRLGLSREALLGCIGDYDAIITRSGTAVDRALLDAATRLKIVARAGVGIDNVDVDYASAKGVIVVNAPFGNTNSAAEHTLALLLAACRHVPAAHASLKAGEWKRAKFTGVELKGKTAGVIGLGKVGGRVATRLKAFECDVLGCDPYISAKRGQDLGVRLVDLAELCRSCDILTLHTPLNDETRGMIGAEQLALMKDGVILLNVARGGIIDEAVLLAGLQSGKVSLAAVDVWSEEPPVTDTLRQLIAQERLVVTPHLGANTQEAQVNVAIDVSKEILAYLDKAPLENAVNLPRFDPAVLDQMRPYFKLMAVLSEFGLQLMKGNLDRVTFGFNGAIAHQDCSPLTVSGLAALLDRITDQPVNMVNAGLVAERMGLVVEERKSTQGGAFSNLVTLTLEGPWGSRVLSGTLFEGSPRIVGLRDYAMDFMPEPHMLLLSYLDRPGMIGKIGTLLGRHEINIAFMNLGRREKKGEAMVILSVDSPVPPAVVAELKTATEATFAQALHLPSA